MTEASEARVAPTYMIAGGLPDDIARALRVVDAVSGELITNVIEADAIEGKVRRFDVEDGNLVREGDAYKIVDEDRKIRIEFAETA